MRLHDAWRTRAGRGLIAGLASIFLAFLIFRDARSAQLVAAGDPVAVGATGYASPSARALRAQGRLLAGRFAEAAAQAERALAAAPMDAAALRILALARAEQQDRVGAAAALRLVSVLGWRDTPAQILLVTDALSRHDVAVAAQRADALARRGQQLPVAFAALRAAAIQPGGVQAVAERLSHAPPYRAAFFADVGKLMPAEYGVREMLYALLASGVSPPTVAEVDPYVQMLIARGDAARARDVWMRFGGQDGNRSLALQDGGFDHLLPASNGFNWQVNPVVTAGVSSEDDLERGRSVLRVEDDGSGTGTAWLLRQRVLLAPGGHVLAYDAAFSPAVARGAFRWGVYCGDSRTELPLTSRVVGGAGRWSRIEARFDVPARGCPLQRIELATREVDPPGTASAWFDSAEIR